MNFTYDKLEKIKECNDRIFSSDISKKFNNIIFIYTPPKVGSTTLVSSFRLSVSILFLTIHVHDENMLNILTGYDNTNTVSIIDIIEYNSYLGKNVYVIDVYRTPIERKISEYFEIIANFHFNNLEGNMTKYKIDLLIKRFNKIFPYIGQSDYFFEKYPIEIPQKFDFENKYLIQIKNKIKYIKLRLNDSENWGEILSNIFKTEIIIISDYKTENKSLGELYKKFKNAYKIPINYLENIKKCKYFNYFNSEKEIENYLKFWENKTCENYIPYNKNEYELYNEISKENQFYSFIQREHYLDFGCICKSCYTKRLEIMRKIRSGQKNVDLKINHMEIVSTKRNKKLNIIKKIVKNNNNINMNIKNGGDFSLISKMHL